ncbi:methionine ABC transporter ATP-binding protein [Sinanaerobacter chloroacetimidivorans]|jgi:D-methionine transport system ATP-binding protein|uniref:ATP-binding cassette domain-containing protein n=1 Tax=Sinanaerobacter chloroacetimidivorans TaxID=2818044 RepID=A0A8J8B2U5_9FIRM|nr:ATP-binding cassette domain-containing protein [Sinanaerobacter chloroacetimidivorans]MBR0599096.1 ATP-binding cassette domain-containing protein [Sinanaerobacter chloroacetimidivorans]
MIEIKNLSKFFSTENGDFTAIKNINLTIEDGDIFGIIGMSGAGKSTLIRCINLLEKPSEGQILIDGQDITSLEGRNLLILRRKIGMVFQRFNLLMQRTIRDNVAFPLEIAGADKKQRLQRAEELLDIVGLSSKAGAYPVQLSGGQQQRVSIARALANHPTLLLCDEPTSALDSLTTNSILKLLKDINHKLGVTIIIITHEISVVEKICNKVAIINESEIVEQGFTKDIISNPQQEITKQLLERGELVE